MTASPHTAPLAEQDLLAAEVAELVAAVVPGQVSNPPGDMAALLAGLDSLGRLELLAALEARFDVELTEELIAEFESEGHIARIIRDARTERAELSLE